MIKTITFEEILPFWLKLWTWETEESVPRHSHMMYPDGYFGFDYTPSIIYYAVIEDDKIVAVNSGHTTPDNMYRSRGLWVEPEYRGKGYGILLLRACIEKSIELGCTATWSYPRDTSWLTYKAAGFHLSTEWISSENKIKNAYCIVKNH
jgi:GNAT superfamily N-acetyltransferase